MAKIRLAFLDILRVLSIVAIVVYHIHLEQHIGFPAFGLWWFSLGQLGVYVLIFVSGAALAVSHPVERMQGKIKDFYVGRLSRIYPAFWVAILVSIAISPGIVSVITLQNVVPVVTGFTAWTGTFSGPVSGGFWFISLIVSLYLLYPVLSRFLAWQPEIAMWALVAVSVISAIVLVSVDFMGAADPMGGVTRWFPLCNVAVFGAGIYCVRRDLIPQVSLECETLVYLSEMSFFVYLFHCNLLRLFDVNALVFVAVLLAVCAAAMEFDKVVQKKIRGLSWPYAGRTSPDSCNIPVRPSP